MKEFDKQNFDVIIILSIYQDIGLEFSDRIRGDHFLLMLRAL